ncbi:hypothetical protein HAV_00402 [Candidatus Hepatincola sp. Av]
MKLINEQKIINIVGIILIAIMVIIEIYWLYRDPTLASIMTSFLSTMFTGFSALFTGFIAIITNKNIQQSRKEKQVANEKQYTIQAIMNVLDFIYLIPSNYMDNASSKLPPLITDKEPLNQAFINAKKNLNFLPEKAIQYLFYVNACLRLSKHHYKNTDLIIAKKIGDINISESITHYIFSSSTIGNQLRPKKYTIYDVLENFEENLKAVIKDENFSWKTHNWQPINDEDTIKEYKENIEQGIKEGNPNL